MSNEFAIEVWGDFACFTRPESKVERLTYPVPTPSAMRGVLNAIYNKKDEFYWQIKRIEVLNPIQYISFMRNEVKKKVSRKPIKVEDERTQRQTVALKDVRYRVYAEIVKMESYRGKYDFLVDQAQKRFNTGKCFYQPSLGCREFVAYFEMSDMTRQPINMSFDLGFMLYDVYDFTKLCDPKEVKPYITLFYAKMENGVIEVPEFGSPLVLKPEGV